MRKWISTVAFAFSLTASVLGSGVWELQQEVQGLAQVVGALSLEVEALRAQNEAFSQENAALKKKVESLESELKSLEKTVADGLRACKEEAQLAGNALKKEILAQIPAKTSSKEAPTAQKSTKEEPNFKDNYPKEGLLYVVKPGDTLSKIAQAHHAKVDDIQNANRISDPKSLQAGQEIFIPVRE
jgi:LysM repeat protein